jgi:TARSH-like protein
MRLFAPLVLLALPAAGCSLYFGSDDPLLPEESPTDPAMDPEIPQPPPLPPPAPATNCGTPEVHVVSIYETSSNHSVAGNASVAIERPGRHILVLSSYEATNWHVTLGANVSIRAVELIGYKTQTVDLANIPVTHDTGCGYSYPYNGGGCDTNALFATVQARTGLGVTTFHGCYQASQWALHADGTAASNCNTSAGYKVDEVIARCGTRSGWEPAPFSTLTPPSCTGPRFVRYDAHYGVWVGAILCGAPNRYKLYMSAARDQTFLEIADYAGHGQDHCELVNPAFTIPNEDDITSGGCADCAVGPLVDVIGVPVYARARFGEPFQRVRSRYWADLTTTYYSCGAAIPQ